MEWNNRVTRLLGSKYPIMLGAMQGMGKSKLAAAVSEAGAFGMITAHSLRTPQRLREDIRQARALTDKPFGVNFSIGFVHNPDAMLDVALEEGIEVIETSLSPSGQYGRRIKAAGAKWIHKVATVEHALSTEREGADAIIIVGLEGIGFKHTAQLPTFIAISWAAKQLKVPIIAAGGIGDARTFAGAIALGAEGVCLGTAFMATTECPVSEKWKLSLVKAKPSDPLFYNQALNPPNNEMLATVMKERGNIPQDRWLTRLERVMLKQSPEGRLTDRKGAAGGSLAVAFVDQVVSVEELVSSMVEGASQILTGIAHQLR